MYSWANLRNDVSWIWKLGVAPVALLLVYMLFYNPGGSMAEVWRDHAWPLIAFLIAVFAVACLVAISFRSIFFIQNRGWQRILLLLAMCGFAAPFISLKSHYWNNAEQLLEATISAICLAAFVIAFPQVVYGIVRWVRNGFSETSRGSANEKEPEIPSV